MTVAFVACGLIALALPGVRPALSLRGDPRWFTRLDALALVLGLAAVLLGLTVSVSGGVAHLLTGASLPFRSHLSPGGLMAPALSLPVLIILLGRLRRAVREARQARHVAQVEPWLGQHEDADGHDLVILPTAVPVAYSVSGTKGQIVISEGTRDRLDEESLRFVVAHERAHLRRQHRRYILVATATEAMLGSVTAVARSTLALRLAVERAADEEAAGRERQRRSHLGQCLAHMAADITSGGCTPQALTYRAQSLLTSPAPRCALGEVIATIGLTALTTVTVAVIAHVTSHVPGLLASLRA